MRYCSRAEFSKGVPAFFCSRLFLLQTEHGQKKDIEGAQSKGAPRNLAKTHRNSLRSDIFASEAVKISSGSTPKLFDSKLGQMIY